METPRKERRARTKLFTPRPTEIELARNMPNSDGADRDEESFSDASATSASAAASAIDTRASASDTDERDHVLLLKVEIFDAPSN